MLKFHVREAFGDLEGWLHIAKGRGKDQFVPGFSQLGDCTLGIRSFWYAFNVGCLHMVTEHIVDHQAALIMGIGPAMIPWRANIDKPNFQLICRCAVDHTEAQKCSQQHRGQFGKILHFLISSIYGEFQQHNFFLTLSAKGLAQTGRRIEANPDRVSGNQD